LKGKTDSLASPKADYSWPSLQKSLVFKQFNVRWPWGEPHFGGVIERLMGTAMGMVHELPGTTFSNTQERGSYDSEAAATLTLAELERWLALAIVGPYHQMVHGTLGEPPAARWADGVARHGAPPRPHSSKRTKTNARR
jgi:putative transposase